MRGGLALLVGISLLGALGGCGRSREQREADAVLHAADALRDAPGDALAAREALLGALERQPATAPPAVAARDACVRAYRLLLDASGVEARIRAGLAARGAAGPGALGDLAELSAAEGKIRESAAAMPGCDTALAELRLVARGGRAPR